MTQTSRSYIDLYAGQLSYGSVSNNANKVLGRSMSGIPIVGDQTVWTSREQSNVSYTSHFVNSFERKGVHEVTTTSSTFSDITHIKGTANQGTHYILPDGTKAMMPISKIPNVLGSFVEITENNEIMEKHGIPKRNPSILHLSANTFTQSMNRYLAWIQYRLNILSSNGEAFWKFALLIATRSNIFKAKMIQEVDPHWHRMMSMKELYILINKYHLYFEKLPIDLKFRRVYIPKKTDELGNVIKWRPLGVPTVAWRLYLHTWQQFFMIFLRDVISNHQHGFYKGRGTKTAWEEILTSVVTARDIYEFDLKGFFPSVNTSYAIQILRNVGFPDWLADNLASLSLSYPKYDSLDESIMDESNAIYKYELDQLGLLHTDPEKLNKAFESEFCHSDGTYTGKVLLPIMEFINCNGKELLISLMSEDLDYSERYIERNWWQCLYEYWQVQSALFESFAPLAKADESTRAAKGTKSDPNPTSRDEPGFKYVNEPQVEGFPQGGGTSPILCSLVLGETIFNRYQSTMYADDGLFYGDAIPESVGKTSQIMEKFGLSFAADKSGWVKRDGVWLKELKFLGLIFDPFANNGLGELRASTRNGATLSFDKESLIMELKSLKSSAREDRSKVLFYSTATDVEKSRLSLRIYNYFDKKLSKGTSKGTMFLRSLINWIESSDEYNTLRELSGVFFGKLESRISSLQFEFFSKGPEGPLQFVIVNPTGVPIKEVKPTEIFSWKALVESGEFGFVQSRLYSNSWKVEANQDFTLDYAPNSWAWYAQFARVNLAATSICSYPSDLTEMESLSLALQNDEELDNSFFNRQIRRIYGCEMEKGIFTELGREEFYRLLKLRITKDVEEIDKAMAKSLRVRVITKNVSLKSSIDKFSFKSHLTVFNSSSYAFPYLVNLFRIQSHLDSWRTWFSRIGLSKPSLKVAMSYLRFGYSPVALYKQLLFNPTMLDGYPNILCDATYYTSHLRHSIE